MLQPKLIKVEPHDKYRIMLYYETGEIKLFDVKPYISGSWFEEFLDVSYFKTVHLLPNGTGIKWLNG